LDFYDDYLTRIVMRKVRDEIFIKRVSKATPGKGDIINDSLKGIEFI